MNIASRLRLCALPLAVSLALAAWSGSSTPPDGHKAAEPPAATAAADTAMPAGWQRVAGAEMPAVHDQKAVLPAKVQSDDGADIEVIDTRRIIAGGDDVI
ncbi:hemin ABC transporter substrate-binding protein, partial [Stenotrophomonas sp. SG1]|nr:hemin ABC transporter substrate-binding protein [Stenotrophomonas sp. SG1]